MPANYLVTGPPRIGKTTAVERTAELLSDRGLTVGGLYAPEIREDGDRVGFEVVDALTGESATMAHVDREGGPSVGKYRVDVDAVDRVARGALDRARTDADAAVVDEIAPMEVESEAFVEGVESLLDSAVPVVAAVHYRSTGGTIGRVKAREDVELFELDRQNRGDLPASLARRVVAALE